MAHSESNQDNDFTLNRPVATKLNLPLWPRESFTDPMIAWKKNFDSNIKSNKIGKHLVGWKNSVCDFMTEIEFMRTFTCFKCTSKSNEMKVQSLSQP